MFQLDNVVFGRGHRRVSARHHGVRPSTSRGFDATPRCLAIDTAGFGVTPRCSAGDTEGFRRDNAVFGRRHRGVSA
jgi:hypothetical protein